MKKCKFKVGKRQLTEQQLKEYQESLQIDSKFSPIQLSDKLKKDYYDVLETTEQEAINTLAPKDISTIGVFDDVKLFHYAEESKPNWTGLNGNVESAKEALIKDREVIDTFYQLDSEETKSTEPKLKTKLESKLKNFLKGLNFDVEITNNIRDLIDFDAISATDLLYKTSLISEDYQKEGLLKEAAYVGYSLLGTRNKIRTDLFYSIEQIDNYTSIYKQYKNNSPNLSEYKIKELIVIDFLADAIYNNFNTPKKSYIHRKADYWAITGSTKIEKQLKYYIGKLKRILEQILNISPLDKKSLYDLVDDLANDILNMSFEKFGSEVSSEQQQVHYEETIATDKKAKDIILNLQNIGLTLSGSLALRAQGTLFRTEKENLHDIDFNVTNNIYEESLGKHIDDFVTKNIKSLKQLDSKGFNKLFSNYVLPKLKDSKLVKDIQKIYPDFTPNIVFPGINPGDFTLSGLIGEHSIDLFFVKNQKEEDNIKYFHHWIPIFKAKLRMGRSKDIRDFVNFKPYNTKKTKLANEAGLRHFNFNTIRKNESYQLKNDVKPLTKPELKTKLLSFINTQGFEAKVITEFEKSQERNGKTFTVKGFVDLMNKVVKYDEQSLPEEAATVARAMYVKDDSTIYDQVRETETYKRVKAEYGGIYETELDLAKEALDKLLAQEIIRKDGTGRLAMRLKRIWNNFMSWIKGNKELTKFLDEMSSQILENNVVGLKNEGVTGVFYQIEEIKFDSKEQELLYKGITSLKQRLKGLNDAQVGKKIGLNLREKIDLLEQQLEQKQYEAGINDLLKYFNEDSKAALSYINNVRLGKTVVDAKRVRYLGEFIEYYFPVLTQLRSSINRGDIKNNGRIKIIKEELNRFDDINDFYKDNMRGEAESFVGMEIGEKTNTDVNMATYLFGSLRDVPDQVLRKVHAVVSKILKNVQNVVYDLGKDLVNSFDGDFNTEKFRERVNGKKTHYFLSQFKLGEFYKEYDDFVSSLKKEYGITTGLPIDRQQRIEYNRKLNDWKSKNTERKFVAEYYDLFNALSLQTVLAKESYDLAIRNILLEVTNSNNQIEFDKLTDEQFEELERLESDRKGLANLYHFDGTKKEGTDLEIALELKALYDVLKDKLESVKFTKAFQELQANKKRTLSDSEYKKWFDRVSAIEYDKKFYEELEKLDSYDYGMEYEQLKEEKNELLKRYRNSELVVNANLVSEDIHKRIYEIEVRMNAIRKADKTKKSKSDFDKVAEIKNTKYYYEEVKKQEALGEESYKEWIANNHIDGKPISIWTQLVPKNKDYIHVVPKRYWAETSEDSEWYNKNFNPDWKGVQPKKKWANPDYDKLTTKEKENLKNLITLKNQGDDLYKVGSRNYYQLPQISKSTMDVFTSENRMANMRELIGEGFVDKIDDDQFGEIEVRADGSQIKYIPKYYTKQLDNADFISDDLIRTVIKYRAAAEKYKQMSNVAPELELVMEAIGERRFVGKKKALSGKETNTYKTLKGFVDHHVYAIQQEPMGYFNLFGKTINTSKLLTKLEKYVRDKNLVFNLFTTVTAYTTASINSKIEDLVGTYTDQKSKLFAEREYDRNAIHMLSETDKAVKTNKLSLIMEKLGFLEDPFNDLDRSRLTRLASSTPYASYGLVSHRIKTKLALAMMSHYRIVDGKLVTQKQLGDDVKWKSLPNIYELFKIENGKATIPKDLEAVFVDLQLKIEFIANRIDGALSPTDKGAAHRHAFLQLLTTHRNWLFSGIQNRAKQKGLNEITGEYEVGYYRGWFDFLKTSFMKPNRMRLLKNMIERWGELEDYEKVAVMRTMYEIAMAVAVGVIALILNKAADDSDDDDFFIPFLAYTANRTLLEASVFPSAATLMLPVASVEVTGILNSPIAATSTLNSLTDIVHLFSDKELESGTYEGFTKGEKTLISLMPGVRGFHTSRDPKSANTFLKSKSLRWIYD